MGRFGARGWFCDVGKTGKASVAFGRCWVTLCCSYTICRILGWLGRYITRNNATVPYDWWRNPALFQWDATGACDGWSKLSCTCRKGPDDNVLKLGGVRNRRGKPWLTEKGLRNLTLQSTRWENGTKAGNTMQITESRNKRTPNSCETSRH